MGKRSSALITLIRTFSSVNSLMTTEDEVLCKRFPTFTTFINTFSSVNSLMNTEGRNSDKRLPTFRTQKTLSSSMEALALKGVITANGFLAFSWDVIFFSLKSHSRLRDFVSPRRGVSIQLLTMSGTDEKAFSNLTRATRIPGHMEIAALFK